MALKVAKGTTKERFSKMNPSQLRPGEMLTVRQVAQILSVAPKTVRRMIDSCEICSYKIRGKRLISRTELLQFITSSRQGESNHA